MVSWILVAIYNYTIACSFVVVGVLPRHLNFQIQLLVDICIHHLLKLEQIVLFA